MIGSITDRIFPLPNWKVFFHVETHTSWQITWYEVKQTVTTIEQNSMLCILQNETPENTQTSNLKTQHFCKIPLNMRKWFNVTNPTSLSTTLREISQFHQSGKSFKGFLYSSYKDVSKQFPHLLRDLMDNFRRHLLRQCSRYSTYGSLRGNLKFVLCTPQETGI